MIKLLRQRNDSGGTASLSFGNLWNSAVNAICPYSVLQAKFVFEVASWGTQEPQHATERKRDKDLL